MDEKAVRITVNWKVAVFPLVLWLLLSLGSFFLLAVPRQQRFDFYPRWVGSRAVLHGENPYTQSVTQRIQEGMFGRRLEAYEDQQGFAYTPLVVWLLLPFWLVSFPLAVSLWCGLQLLALLLSPLLIAYLLRWSIRPVPLLVLLVFSLLGYRYPINAYLLGQFIPFVLACVVVALFGIMHRKPILSASALILAMVRPEIAVIPVMALLVVSWRARQWKAVSIWFVGVIALGLLSRLWIGAWEQDFIGGISAYAEYSSPVWPLGEVRSQWLVWALVLAVLCWTVWMWLELRSLDHYTRPVWAVSVAVLVALVVLPQTGNYTMVLGLLPVWLMLWAARRRLLGWILILAVLLLPWVFHTCCDVPSLEQLVIPLVLSTALSVVWCLWKKRRAATAFSDGS